MRQRLRTYFLTGIVVAAPVLITLYLISSVIGAIDELVTPLLPPEVRRIGVPGIGVAVVVIGLTLLGAVAANVIGNWLLKIWEYLVNHTPVIRAIYRPVKQVFETVIGPGGMSFREVVLVEYPSDGRWVLGFVTAKAPAAVAAELAPGDDGDELVSVYLPTAPNLYAGFLLFQPRSRLKHLDMSVDEAVKLMVSAGIAGQGDKPKTGK
ncbi:DUF502 domain-containing protein [Pedomonas mirosovicensis]|uniref:DUF502 domain-containing protein n=1 Tax=Pedomonas mirosovicensis TaxID=2908641 RepID=UPI0021683946|nr:DUF502 domain-containing protein [Pedomonas mirosovicensis]MCH8685218.1 DUF502 domain-containing protein [Pedomonas mirosovicensis]